MRRYCLLWGRYRTSRLSGITPIELSYKLIRWQVQSKEIILVDLFSRNWRHEVYCANYSLERSTPSFGTKSTQGLQGTLHPRVSAFKTRSPSTGEGENIGRYSYAKNGVHPCEVGFHQPSHAKRYARL